MTALLLFIIAAQPAAVSREKAVELYTATCQVCHGPEGKGSALDYIRSVLAESKTAAPADMRRTTAATTAPAAAPARSQWERYTLADGMELHIRRPLSRVEQKQFEKLMAAARTVFSETEGEA